MKIAKIRLTLGLFLSAAIALATLLASSASSLFAQQVAAPAASSVVPRLINFSGVVRGGDGKPLAGTVGVTFSLFKDQEGGAPLWFETQNVQADNSGRYKVWLGASKPDGLPMDLFTSGDARWLGVQVEGQSEQPRVLLLSVPYALKAADAETVGGLPPSAFMLAGSKSASAAPRSTSLAAAAVVPLATGTNAVTTAGGTVNSVAKFDGTADITPSLIYDDGTHVGIANTAPAAILDVGGTSIFRGVLTLPALGTANLNGGFNSNALDLIASSFNTALPSLSTQRFRWLAEPVHSGTPSARATLNLLYSHGFDTPHETGVSIDPTGVLSVSRLQASGVINATSFSLNGTPFASGNFGSGNVFLGFSGNGAAAGTSNTASGAQALSSDTTGGANTAIGQAALWQNTSGSNNTATGEQALTLNTTGNSNTATGISALVNNTTGNGNTAAGYATLKSNATGGNNSAFGFYAGNTTNQVPTTGSNNTFVGSYANPGTQTALSNATAIGANAQVTASNAMVLGSINGVNGATADTKVGIGTTAPTTLLHINHAVPHGGADVMAITSGGSIDVASLLLQNTSSGGLHLRLGAGTGSSYLASSGTLAFVAGDSGIPSVPSLPAMSIDALGNVNMGNASSLRVGSNTLFAVDSYTYAGGRLVVGNNGLVGINNPFPADNLDVGGNAIIRGNASLSGNVTAVQVKASSVQINGDTPMSNAPHMTFSGYVQGGFCSENSCSPYAPAGFFVPDKNIVITRMNIAIPNPPDSSCIGTWAGSPVPGVVIGDGSNVLLGPPAIPAPIYILQLLAGTTTIDSGPLSLSIPAGKPLIIMPESSPFCALSGAYQGGPAFVNVQYVMQ